MRRELDPSSLSFLPFAETAPVEPEREENERPTDDSNRRKLQPGITVQQQERPSGKNNGDREGYDSEQAPATRPPEDVWLLHVVTSVCAAASVGSIDASTLWEKEGRTNYLYDSVQVVQVVPTRPRWPPTVHPRRKLRFGSMIVV